LTLFKETIAVYAENEKYPSTQNADLLIGKAGRYHLALEV
jgi:hypothetical protein